MYSKEKLSRHAPGSAGVCDPATGRAGSVGKMRREAIQIVGPGEAPHI